MRMKTDEKLKPSNVCFIMKRDKASGKVLEQRSGYNIVVNTGRTWIRGLLGVSSFQQAPDAAEEYPGKEGSAWTVDEALAPPFNNYRLRYMGLGTGGMYATAGTFQESVFVSTLETPIRNGAVDGPYLKEILPSADPTDLEVFPTEYDFMARCVWDDDDIAYLPATTVDISEIMICTSQADPATVAPNLTNYPAGFPGIVAYNCFTPITIEDGTIVEALWLWRL